MYGGGRRLKGRWFHGEEGEVFGEIPAAVVWGAVVLAGIIVVVILVSLLTSGDEESEDVRGADIIDPDVPVDLRQLAVLYRIDRKLRAVHLLAILLLIGWLLSCLAVSIGLALGPTVLFSDVLRRLLR